MPQTTTQQQAALGASGLNAGQQAQIASGTYGAPAAPATPALATPVQPISSPAPLQTPVPAASITPSASPSLPQPQATTVQQQYFGGVASDLQNAKDTLQSSYDKQSADISSQLDTLKTQQQDALNQEKTLSQPVQQQIEQTQEQALHVNSNFEANQGLANELSSLVTEANSRLSGETNRFASTSSISAGYNKNLQDITARAGLIQSAMAAYNGQIGQAYTLIDRSVAAINADRTDQLHYYNTLLTLNDNKQLDLGNQAKTIAQQKVALLQNNVDEVQKSADAIKQAMLDPATAQTYAQAGVTLTDTTAQIGTKLSDYGYSKELATQNNQLSTNGFTAVLPGQSAPAGAQVVSLTDSRGNAKQYYSTSAKTQVVSLGNGSSRLINSETGAVIASYGGSTGNAATTGGASGGQANVPTAVAPYVNTSHSGVTYADLSTVQGTASQKKGIIDQAQAAGIKVITNKNTALDLTNIEDANAKLDTISSVMSGIDQPTALSRSLYGLGLTKLATMAQTNPQQAAAGALQGVGLDILKAISGVQGFRGNSAVVQQITDHLPSIYDTNDTAQQKVNFIRALISDRENAILGKAGTNATVTEPTDRSKGATWSRPDGTYISDGTQWVKQ
jgi:hypothetical protein